MTGARVPRSKMRVALHEKEEEEVVFDDIPEETGEDGEEALSPSAIRSVVCIVPACVWCVQGYFTYKQRTPLGPYRRPLLRVPGGS